MIERCQLQAVSCLSSKKIQGRRTSTWKLALNVAKPATQQKKKKKLLCTSNYCQDPVHTENNKKKKIQGKVGHSPQIPAPQKNLSGLLGLITKDRQCLPATERPAKAALGSWGAAHFSLR